MKGAIIVLVLIGLAASLSIPAATQPETTIPVPAVLCTSGDIGADEDNGTVGIIVDPIMGGCAA